LGGVTAQGPPGVPTGLLSSGTQLLKVRDHRDMMHLAFKTGSRLRLAGEDGVPASRALLPGAAGDVAVGEASGPCTAVLMLSPPDPRMCFPPCYHLREGPCSKVQGKWCASLCVTHCLQPPEWLHLPHKDPWALDTRQPGPQPPSGGATFPTLAPCYSWAPCTCQPLLQLWCRRGKGQHRLQKASPTQTPHMLTCSSTAAAAPLPLVSRGQLTHTYSRACCSHRITEW